MKPSLLIPLPGNELLTASLAAQLGTDVMAPEIRTFPDGETYLRLHGDLHGRSLAFVCSLDRPDGKVLPLLFAAGTANDLGAASVGLVAPYLAYMRQDRRFQPGEALSARLFATYLAPHFDWLVTVDPHLHRIHKLDSIYTIPTQVVHAADAIAGWIAREVARPLLVGPDSESVQWVSDVAKFARAPVVTLTKRRIADDDVEIEASDLSRWKDHTPVLVDDLISTAQTMAQTLKVLRSQGMKPAVCIGVHGLFAGDAFQNLLELSPARVVTTNTVSHPTNGIDISPLLASGIRRIAN